MSHLSNIIGSQILIFCLNVTQHNINYSYYESALLVNGAQKFVTVNGIRVADVMKKFLAAF